ncbi:MAG: lysophospholipid acyltransferase family protein [Endomicrobium sp.]|jgi:KDO2-lipid IV(A) lauroyltransferase|nr:lysophospholipid acyltransferase family protein [Endomicrobium sp.]
MSAKRTNLQNYAEYYGLKILMFTVCLLHRSIAQFFGRILSFLLFYFIPVRKKQLLENIVLAFPEKSKQNVNLIAKNTYKTFARIFIDMFFIFKMSGDEVEKLLTYDKNMIDKALARGKGLVLLSAHFGNWELSALALAKKYTVALIVAKQSNDFVNRIISSFRNKEGFNVIDFQRDDKMSFRHIIKALRKNYVLAILGDQDAGHQGVFIPFFGKLASTPKGPAFFAIHAGSPIITAFGVYQKDGSMKMKLEELPIPNTGDEKKDIEIINGIYNERLEDIIRENPEQWFWFHRRWNTRPKNI